MTDDNEDGTAYSGDIWGTASPKVEKLIFSSSDRNVDGLEFR